MGLWAGRACPFPFWGWLLPLLPKAKLVDEGDGREAPVLPTAGPAMLLVWFGADPKGMLVEECDGVDGVDEAGE